MKKSYFVETNGYNMLVVVDENNNCRYITETNEFPYLVGLEEEEKRSKALDFLKSVEDISSWNEDCSYDELFNSSNEVIAEISVDL